MAAGSGESGRVDGKAVGAVRQSRKATGRRGPGRAVDGNVSRCPAVMAALATGQYGGGNLSHLAGGGAGR